MLQISFFAVKINRMAGQNITQQAKQQQTQTQVLNQVQLNSLSLLSMGGDDLREAIYREAEENPALVITKDSGGNVRVKNSPQRQGTRTGSSSASGEEASEKFQAVLESKADTRCSLQDYLLMQLHTSPLGAAEVKIGENLIRNLDSRGFHILAPVSLLDKNDSTQTQEALEAAMQAVQQFDPPGTCTKNTEESLYVQAKQRSPACPVLALFLLDGHFDFLNPPKANMIANKVTKFFEEQKKLFGVKENPLYKDMEINEKEAQKALDFIRTLDPYPARDYSTDGTHYVSPDIYVERIPQDLLSGTELTEDFAKGIVIQGKDAFLVRLTSDIPQLAVSPEYSKFSQKENSDVVNEGIKRAQIFISSIENRQTTVLHSACMIAKKQHEFFAKGPGHLSPLKQQDIADVVGVHETTISRMASSKYIQCEWGLFPVKYFFVNAVGSADSPAAISRDKVMSEIEKIMQEHAKANSGKKLSDQKISDILRERGMQVARRTVAKYRAQMQ